MWHIGMDDVLRNYPPYIPRINNKVTLNIGEPIDLRELLAEIRLLKLSPVSNGKTENVNQIGVISSVKLAQSTRGLAFSA